MYEYIDKEIEVGDVVQFNAGSNKDFFFVKEIVSQYSDQVLIKSCYNTYCVFSYDLKVLKTSDAKLPRQGDTVICVKRTGSLLPGATFEVNKVFENYLYADTRPTLTISDYNFKFTNNWHRSSFKVLNKKEETMKEFTNKDLKTGMIVETTDGILRLIWSNTAIALSDSGGGVPVSTLSFKKDNEDWSANVVKVYSEPNYEMRADMTWWIEDKNCIERTKAELLWEYKEPVLEMTLEEICNALGKNIKIVKG